MCQAAPGSNPPDNSGPRIATSPDISYPDFIGNEKPNSQVIKSQVIKARKQEIMMRILVPAVLAMAAISTTPSAQAQTYDPKYPVCLQIFVRWNDSYFECAYTSLEQCRWSASGRSAMCVENPYFVGKKASPGRRERRERRTY